jgi:transglutaminase-like putative cysteine protease
VHYVIEHETLLRFPEPVREHQVELRLAPREDEHQRLLACTIEVEPAAELHRHLDAFGNTVHRFSLVAPHDRLGVRMRVEVETYLENPFDWLPLAPAAEAAWLAERRREDPRLLEFVLHRSDAVPDPASFGDALAPPAPRPDRPLVENVQALAAWAHERFAYDAVATDVHAPLAVFVEKRGGVCQDFAHLLVAVVRSWGVPARYVSGYLDPGALGEDEPVEATHAWAEVLLPGAGWRGFDATHALVANDHYVPVAVGRDSQDAAPLRGAFKGGNAGEPPRVRLRMARHQQ